jgi:hypothetical protein
MMDVGNHVVGTCNSILDVGDGGIDGRDVVTHVGNGDVRVYRKLSLSEQLMIVTGRRPNSH